jgi:phage shock protein PspC (stress-responsive transcriptional regulator)
MKKVININFQGRIILIEEDAYEQLKNYVESLRQYFVNEEGKEEIINDIENRIAELFTEKIKSGPSNFITEEAVAGIIASIGRPEEFDVDNVEIGSNSSSSSRENSRYTDAGFEPRGSLFRNENDKMLGGVCSGIGAYLRIDTTIIRVLFALFTLGAFGTGFVLYIILWAILPSKIQENKFTRRLYRNADQKVLGGVCSGISKYFNIAVWIPRLIFALPIILSIFRNTLDFHFFFFPIIFTFSGTLFLTYLILWAVIPKAITTSEKMEMQGQKVDLESIKNKVKDELDGVKKNFTENTGKWKQDLTEKASNIKDEAQESAKRFAGEAGTALRKNSNRFGHFIFTLIKVFFFFILSIIAFALVMAVIGLITAGAALVPLKDFIAETKWVQLYAWGTLILFFIVPVVALVQWLIKKIAGIKQKHHYIAYTLGILWAAGWVSAVLLVSTISKEFKRSGQVSNEVSIVQPSNGRMKVEFKDVEGKYYPLDLNFDDNDDDLKNSLRLSASEDSLLLGNIKIQIEKSSDDKFHVTTVRRARSSTPLLAEQIAESIPFQLSQADSILTLPIAFPITSNTKFRNQQVRVQIEIPVGKEIFINDRADNLQYYSVITNGNGLTIDWDNENGVNYFWRSGVWYIMTEHGLEKKYKDSGDTLDGVIEKVEKEFNKGAIDSINVKVKEGDTTINISIRSHAKIDLEQISEDVEDEEPRSWKGRKILFSAMDLLRIRK